MDSEPRLAKLRGLRRIARAIWQHTPVVVQAIIIGELILAVGGLPEFLLFINLKIAPAVPWSLITSALWLWFCWRYLDGAGWPKSTSAQRKIDLRGRTLSPRVLCWALLAGGLGMISVDALAFLTPRLAGIPREAFKLPVDLSTLPAWTTWALLLAISAFAGVLEEAAFRGYMLSRIERRHGWVVGILVTGTVFFLDHHFSHAYATFAFLPFFLAVSTLHGLLVYFTGSIWPSVVLHTLADLVVIPIQYGIVGHAPTAPITIDNPDAAALICFGLLVGCALAAIPAFVRLAHAARAAAIAVPD